MAPELPSRIDRYRILDRLGHGSMGDVYLAVDPKLDRRIALKVMSLHRLGEEDELGELRMRFVQEARAAGRLTHPGIVTVYDADTDETTGYPFIAMELAGGSTLRTHLRRHGPLDVEHAVALVAQVARALDYAHGEGVVHRDIKPANLLLDAGGRQAKIADFGVAKLVSNSLTLTGQVLGSPNYMAPEQVKAQEVDGRTDLWGLGVVLYECLAGRPPFASESLASITFKIVSVDPRPVEIYNPRVPDSLGRIVRRALEKEPDDRFHSGAEMADALEAVQSELASQPELAHTRELKPPPSPLPSPAVHRPEPISDRVSPTGLRRRGSGWAVAATLLVAAAFLGVGYWAVGSDETPLPLLTRQLGVFADGPDETPVAEKPEAESAPTPEADNPTQALPDDTASASEGGETRSGMPGQAATPPEISEDAEDSEELAAAELDDPPDTPPSPTAETRAPPEPATRDAPGSSEVEEAGAREDDGAAQTAVAAPAEPPELPPPPVPKTRLRVAVENKIKLAMISVWIDGDRVLTRPMETSSWFERRVGHTFVFEVRVPIGEHKVEVHVSGLSSKLEARSSIRGRLTTGRAAVLDVEIDRRRQALNLSWRS